jgi:hypothetical protein
MTHISVARIRIDDVQMLGEPTFPYNCLMNYFLENIKNTEMPHHYYPTARGYFLFEKQQIDCLFPGELLWLN